MAMHLGGDGSGGGYSTVSDINITPFVDVVLVLLIIFMVTAPQLQQGFEIDVPAVAAKTMEIGDNHVVVSVDRDRRIRLDKFEVVPEALASELAKVFESRADKRLFIRADKEVPYGAVMDVLAAAREAGIVQIGMVTAAPEAAAKPGSAAAPGAPTARPIAPAPAAAPAPAPAQGAAGPASDGRPSLADQLPLED